MSYRYLFKYKDFSFFFTASSFTEACNYIFFCFPTLSLSSDPDDGIDWIGNYLGLFEEV